jgi:hypothetical protein
MWVALSPGTASHPRRRVRGPVWSKPIQSNSREEAAKMPVAPVTSSSTAPKSVAVASETALALAAKRGRGK